ncbi:hypothetical protein F981_04018 [Acinetobacter guillouiae CIP 63.46]|nr:hypothetical protein F981_04018 [Acinetobacter guillouiae CIP 63.46]
MMMYGQQVRLHVKSKGFLEDLIEMEIPRKPRILIIVEKMCLRMLFYNTFTSGGIPISKHRIADLTIAAYFLL